MTKHSQKTKNLWPGFGTKAETLDRLRPLVTHGEVPELSFFSAAEWSGAQEVVLKRIAKQFRGQLLAIRSSAMAEDSERSSQAGAFRSCLSVPAGDPVALRTAIENVISSMTGNLRDQVLIQTMITDVEVCGVIMTYDMAHGAPYYVIDYDDESGRTDLVTGGNGINKGLYVHRDAEPGLIRSPRIRKFLKLARELEVVTGHPALDIEFVLARDGKLHLVQTRRIAIAHTWHPNTERRVARQLGFVENFVTDRARPRPGLLGSTTILAVMPDWNPAEIIGTTPRPLAASLYRELITRRVWREARALMGYRQILDEELMVMINHHPYIDVRNSFNSFLPEGIPESDGIRLVDAWLERLAAHPELHDKVEFEIASTCRDFCFDEDFKARYAGLLTPKRLSAYRSRLTALTNHCTNSAGTLAQAIAASRNLEQRLGRAGNAPLPANGYEWLIRATDLISSCTRLGTLPFAVAARHAFIAEALLRSAVRKGALRVDRLEAFRRTITTVTSSMVREYADVLGGRQTQSAFQSKYGHLRPGTYEITSLRYDERDDLFLDVASELAEQTTTRFALTATERRALNSLLEAAGLANLNAEGLLDYAKQAIAGREGIKFVFTRALSDALAALVQWGVRQGLSRDDISFVEWSHIQQCLTRAELDDSDRRFLTIADEGRRNLEASNAFRLSHIICGMRDIHVATINRSIPNFVGSGHASGRVVELTPDTPATTGIENRIVCIENADPGFDWIFTKRPAALITKFGGANSHMAIRCAEFGLPAAIGCGEQIYLRIAAAVTVELNCAEKILRPVHVK